MGHLCILSTKKLLKSDRPGFPVASDTISVIRARAQKLHVFNRKFEKMWVFPTQGGPNKKKLALWKV